MSVISCRVPKSLGKLLGEEIENSPIMCDDIGVRATWRGNERIDSWGLCWRDLPDGYVEIACSIKFRGCMLPGHGNVLNVIEMGDDVHILICLLPLGSDEREPDYVAVSLPWRKNSEEVNGIKAREHGMIFDEDSPKDAEEFMTAWEVMHSNRVRSNQALLDAALTGKKKRASQPRKKKDAPDTAIADDTFESGSQLQEGESSRPQRGKGKGKAKEKDKGDSSKRELVYSLDEALLRGNKLTTKTKAEEVDAVYKALDLGLAHAFPYRKRRLPGVIQSDRLHIAPDALKYRKMLKDRLGQVSSISSRIM